MGPSARSKSMGFLWLLMCSVAAVMTNPASADTASDYLTPHNQARTDVGASVPIPPLVWDTTLATYATQWAQNQATYASCALTHSGGPYGENIYWSGGASTPQDAVAAWVAEKQYYDYATNSCQAGQVCGHYTQVVWRNTQTVGCGSATCPGGGNFVVCSYNPPGNYIGEIPY